MERHSRRDLPRGASVPSVAGLSAIAAATRIGAKRRLLSFGAARCGRTRNALAMDFSRPALPKRRATNF